MVEVEIFSGNTAKLGLQKIAFTPVNDALSLITQLGELNARSIKKLDLFPVSEIKLPKGGGCEIKFYDRLKALELLAAYEQTQNTISQTSSFLEALEKAAAAACEDGAL